MADLQMLQNLFGLDGQLAVVTGGAQGIGKAIAATLAGAGARVVIANRNAGNGEQAARALRDQGLDATAIATDVADEKSVLKLFATVREQLGDIDILVNNAGITNKYPLTEATPEQWDEIQRINLRGAFLCLREAAKSMIAAGKGGRIVNVSSTSSVHPGVHGNAAYSASKGGVNMLTKSAALDLAAENITVNAVLPGGTLTEGVVQNRDTAPRATGPAADFSRYLLGRLANPDEVAAAVLYFAGPAGTYVTGQLLAVDGGFLVS